MIGVDAGEEGLAATVSVAEADTKTIAEERENNSILMCLVVYICIDNIGCRAFMSRL